MIGSLLALLLIFTSLTQGLYLRPSNAPQPSSPSIKGYIHPIVDPFRKQTKVSALPVASYRSSSPGMHTLSLNIPNGYYDEAIGESGTDLREALKTIINRDARKNSYTYVWTMCEDADQCLNDDSQVYEIYLERCYDKDGRVSVDRNGWNREHVWAKSHGDFGTRAGPGTDGHHLRASDAKENSKRSNYNFCDCGGERETCSGCYQPPNSAMGDVARSIFYMAVRWEFTVDNDNEVSKRARHGKLDVLLAGHVNDPIDSYEVRRNERIYYHQNNRNPFIDYPELVDYVFGSKQSEPWYPDELGNFYRLTHKVTHTF